MNCLFSLSQAYDLAPLYDAPMPLELLDVEGPSFFQGTYEEFYEIFPDARYFVVDGGEKAAFHRTAGYLDTFQFPTESTFTRIFLYSAFAGAYNLSPMTLYFPGNFRIRPFEEFAALLRKTSLNTIAVTGITYFCGNDPAAVTFIERGELIASNDQGPLYNIKSFIGLDTLRLWQEANPGRNPSERYLPVSGIFLFNSIRFCDSLAQYNESLPELFIMLQNAWKDGRTIQTLLKETIAALDGFSMKDFLAQIDEKFVIPVESEVLRLDGFPRYLEKLPLDDNGNYVRGNVEIQNVSNSFIINKSKKGIVIRDFSGITALSDDSRTQIKRI